MFESGVSIANHPDFQLAADKSFQTLKSACEAVIATMKGGSRPPAMMMALHIWAVAHGVASLFARGDSGRRSLPMTPADLLEAQLLIYLDGLGVDAR